MIPTIVLIACLAPCAIIEAAVLPMSSKSTASGLIPAINAARAQRSLSPFSPATALESAAATQASFCAELSTLTHTGAGGSSVGDRVTAAGYSWGATGEVLAMGGVGYNMATAEKVVGMWEGSATHWDILMGEFEEAGCAESEEYYACVVGSPRSAASPAPPSSDFPEQSPNSTTVEPPPESTSSTPGSGSNPSSPPSDSSGSDSSDPPSDSSDPASNAPDSPENSTASDPPSTSTASALIPAINAARAQRSLSPFVSASALTSAAATQASFCAERSTLTHTGAGGSSVGDRVSAAGYAWRNTGEVLAMGGVGTAAEGVVGMWEGSATHWEILMGDYEEAGCAESGVYYACVVGSPGSG